MIPADQFLQCDVRIRQAKMNPDVRFGGLAVNFCGDFLQLPPVNKDGSKPSLAKPFREQSTSQVDNEDNVPNEVDNNVVSEEGRAESRQGFELWHSVKRAVSLCVNVRAPDILSRVRSATKCGSYIFHDAWK